MKVEIKDETFDKAVENVVKSQVCMAVKEEMGKDLGQQMAYIEKMTEKLVSTYLDNMDLSEQVSKFLAENKDEVIESAGTYLAKAMASRLGLEI